MPVPIKALAWWLESEGLDAEVVPRGDPDELQQGFLRRDPGYVRLRGRNVSLVTARAASSYSVSALPFVARAVQNVDLHHIVRRDPSDDPVAFEAELKVRRRDGKVLDAVWVGGRVAARLFSVEDRTRHLRGLIGPHERIRVRPDVAHRAVRIVHRIQMRVGFSLPQLLREDRIEMESGLPSRAMLDAIDEAAGCILRTGA